MPRVPKSSGLPSRVKALVEAGEEEVEVLEEAQQPQVAGQAQREPQLSASTACRAEQPQAYHVVHQALKPTSPR